MGCRFGCEPQDRAWLRAVGLDDVEALLRHRPARLVALGASSDVFLLPLPTCDAPGAPRAVFVKRYRVRGRRARTR